MASLLPAMACVARSLAVGQVEGVTLGLTSILGCLGGLLGAVALDALALPRGSGHLGLRNATGLCLLICQVVRVFGLVMAVCGSIWVSIVLTLATLALLVLASNAKYTVLGEPLVFSDLALIGAIFRHPQFYLSAIPVWQRCVVGAAAVGLIATIAALFVVDLGAHAVGLGILLSGLCLLAFLMCFSPIKALARAPHNEADVRRIGLTPTLMLYWLRWRKSEDPPPYRPEVRSASQEARGLLIVVQCESFADPKDVFSDQMQSLPNLEEARRNAWQYGNLHVSGFGAYTMRTEYAVLFGREEKDLGFRRYDPFLTALGETTYALPRRLGKAWRSLFIHPHDMRFYGRDKIMPAAGFDELVGEDRFDAPLPGEGRYVTDAAMAKEILALAKAAQQPSLLYAVTIENHGPWASDTAGGEDLMGSYLRLARNSDTMIRRLIDGLAELRGPATLVFFGDHRPSIPGVTNPHEARYTPYVIVRLNDGQFDHGENRRVDLTPAELHHTMLDIMLGRPV